MVEINKNWKPVPVRIEIEVESKGKTPELTEKYLLVPQKIADLDKKQFESLSHWYFTPVFKEEQGFVFLQQLLELSTTDFTAIDAESISALLPLINPFKINKPISATSKYPEFTTTICDCKKKHDGECESGERITFYGPKNWLSNLTFDEKIFADLLMDRFLNSRDIKDLNQFVALLYREKNVSYSDWDESPEPLVEKMSKVMVVHKYAALLNYMSIRNALPSRFKNVFRQTGGTNGEPDWRKITVALAGEKLGTPDMVRKTNALDVLSMMDDMMEKK